MWHVPYSQEGRSLMSDACLMMSVDDGCLMMSVHDACLMMSVDDGWWLNNGCVMLVL